MATTTVSTRCAEWSPGTYRTAFFRSRRERAVYFPFPNAANGCWSEIRIAGGLIREQTVFFLDSEGRVGVSDGLVPAARSLSVWESQKSVESRTVRTSAIPSSRAPSGAQCYFRFYMHHPSSLSVEASSSSRAMPISVPPHPPRSRARAPARARASPRRRAGPPPSSPPPRRRRGRGRPRPRLGASSSSSLATHVCARAGSTATCAPRGARSTGTSSPATGVPSRRHARRARARGSRPARASALVAGARARARASRALPRARLGERARRRAERREGVEEPLGPRVPRAHLRGDRAGAPPRRPRERLVRPPRRLRRVRVLARQPRQRSPTAGFPPPRRLRKLRQRGRRHPARSPRGAPTPRRPARRPRRAAAARTRDAQTRAG